MNYATGFHDYRENAIRILTETGFFKGVIYEEEGNCRRLTNNKKWQTKLKIREGIEMEHCLKWDMWREECLAGSLLCYSLTLDTTRERSTLAVRKYSDRIEARQVLHMIQQHLKGCIE